MLYKSFEGEGFNLLSPEFRLLEEGLNFVHLWDVAFIVDEEKKKIMKEQDKRNVHAVANGVLKAALPKGYKPSISVMELMQDLPEVGYNPYISDNFYLKDSGEKVEFALDLYAFNGQIKVKLD